MLWNAEVIIVCLQQTIVKDVGYTKSCRAPLGNAWTILRVVHLWFILRTSHSANVCTLKWSKPYPLVTVYRVGKNYTESNFRVIPCYNHVMSMHFQNLFEESIPIAYTHGIWDIEFCLSFDKIAWQSLCYYIMILPTVYLLCGCP
jgi:hypothetical protein